MSKVITIDSEVIEGVSRELKRLAIELETGRYSVNSVVWHLEGLADRLNVLAAEEGDKQT